MSVGQHIIDGDSGEPAKVTDAGELVVVVSHDPQIAPHKRRIFRQYMTDTGQPSGDNDIAAANGSTTAPVDFCIQAQPEVDRYITNLSVIVGYGTTGQPNEWCDGTALTNGFQLLYSTNIGDVEIHDGVKNNQDFFRLSHNSIVADWELRHVNASNDFGYFLTIDFDSFMPPYGIQLDRGTTQKLILRVRDNMTTLTESFNVIAYGFDRFE